jgi:predicted small secreted protein
MGERGSARGRRALLAIAATVVTGLVGCNTIEGAGRDLETLGRTLADSAERAKP